MAQSISALQLEPCIKPWRKVEIRRRSTSGTYESTWYDVSKYVTRWPEITFDTDILKPFVFRFGAANMSFRNDEKQFASEEFAGSIFSGKLTRYRTLCRISTGLEDTDGTQYPSDGSTFYGMFSYAISDTEEETHITINSIAQVIQDIPASFIEPALTGLSLTSAQIINKIIYATDGSSNIILSPFLSASVWDITSTARTYYFGADATSTLNVLNGMSCLDLISELAVAENRVFYIDKSGRVKFVERTNTGSVVYNFNGTGRSDVNVEMFNKYDEGVSNLYTKFTIELSSGLTVSNQESWAVGDNSSTWKYGSREYYFNSEFLTSGQAASITAELLLQFKTPKKELEITTKYIAPNLNLFDKVAVYHYGERSGLGSTWDNYNWDFGTWSDEKGGIFVDSLTCYITGIKINMNDWYTCFSLRGV